MHGRVFGDTSIVVGGGPYGSEKWVLDSDLPYLLMMR